MVSDTSAMEQVKKKCPERFDWICRNEPVSFRDTGILFPRKKHHYSSGGIVVLLEYYQQTFNIRRTFVGNKIVDHSDVVGASSVGAAPSTSSFSN